MKNTVTHLITLCSLLFLTHSQDCYHKTTFLINKLDTIRLMDKKVVNKLEVGVIETIFDRKGKKLNTITHYVPQINQQLKTKENVVPKVRALIVELNESPTELNKAGVNVINLIHKFEQNKGESVFGEQAVLKTIEAFYPCDIVSSIAYTGISIEKMVKEWAIVISFRSNRPELASKEDFYYEPVFETDELSASDLQFYANQFKFNQFRSYKKVRSK